MTNNDHIRARAHRRTTFTTARHHSLFCARAPHIMSCLIMHTHIMPIIPTHTDHDLVHDLPGQGHDLQEAR